MPKRKRRNVADWLSLPRDLWREIFLYVSSGYFLTLWRRVRPVCRLFKSLVKDTRLLRTVSKIDEWTIHEYSILQWMDVWVNRQKSTPSTLWCKLVDFGLDNPHLYDASIKSMLLLDWTSTDSPPRETVGDHTRPAFKSSEEHMVHIQEFCDYWRQRISPNATAVYVCIRPSTSVYYKDSCRDCLGLYHPEGKPPSIRVQACLPYTHAEWTGYQTVRELYDGIIGFSDGNPCQYPIILLLHKNTKRGSKSHVEGMTFGELLDAGSRISPETAQAVSQGYQYTPVQPDTEKSNSLEE